MTQDIFKILKDIELKSVGLDPDSNKMNEGYFICFRNIGLPINKEDYENPYSPLGRDVEKTLNKEIPKSDPIDPKNAKKTSSAQLNENDPLIQQLSKSMITYLNTFMLTDDKLKMSNQYMAMSQASKLSDTWSAIVTGASAIPQELVLNDDLRRIVEEAQSKITDEDGDETPHFEKYKKYERDYTKKVKDLDNAYAAAFTDPVKLQNWPTDGVIFQNDVDEAMQDWITLGFKHEIEEARGILDAQGIDPSLSIIYTSRQRFTNSLSAIGGHFQIPYVFMTPSEWYDKDNDDGWNEYTSIDFHSDSHYTESSTAFGGGGGFDEGFWYASGSLDNSSEHKKFNFNMNNLDVGFKYCSVEINRLWLDNALLNLKNWFLMGDYKKNCISDGTMGQEVHEGNPEYTFLPSIMKSLILIKDLSISWDNWKSEWESSEETSSSSTIVGYGPFAVRGHYNHHGSQNDFECDISGESLVVHGIQLIGYVSTINPPSPAVDSSSVLNRPHS